MAKSVKPIPDGYHSVTPYLIIGRGKASEAIDFYSRAFNAKEIMRMSGPEGGIAHAEVQLGDSRIMLADEAPRIDAYGPDHFEGSPISLLVYVPDVDATAKQAITAGATVNLADGQGVTPLAHAQQRGYTAIAEILRRAGAH